MKILLMDQNLVVPVYRRKWELLATKPGVEMLAISPSVWIDNYRRVRPERTASGIFEILALPVMWPGYENRSFYLRGLGRIMRNYQADILIAFKEPLSLFALQALICSRLHSPRSRIILYTWDNLSKGRWYPYRPAFLYSLIERFTARHADAILAANQEAAEYYSSTYETPVRKVYYGIDLDEYRIDGAEGDVRKVQPRSEVFLVGYIGRVLEMKGVDLLIRAVAQLPDPIRLLIVGEGPALADCKRLANELGLSGRIEFFGSVPASEVRSYLQRLDALVLPSRTTRTWKEQYGRILIEAMAAGVPLVGSSSGAIPEVIGDSGIVFPEQNIPALASAIMSIYLDPALSRAYARAGLKRAEQFSSEQFADSVYEVCLQLFDQMHSGANNGR